MPQPDGSTNVQALHDFAWATAPSRFGPWANRPATWEQVVSRLSDLRRIPERDMTPEEYGALTKIEREKAKDCGGFVLGAMSSTGKRTYEDIVSRAGLGLDIDDVDAPFDVIERHVHKVLGPAAEQEDVEDVPSRPAWVPEEGLDYLIVPSISHRVGGRCSLRLIIPFSAPCLPVHYAPIARRVMAEIDMDMFDMTAAQANRFFYFPTKLAGQPWDVARGDGARLDANAVLATYDNPLDTDEWPKSPYEQTLTGGVGSNTGLRKDRPDDMAEGFPKIVCQSMTMQDALVEYLSDVWAPGKDDDNWTLIGGTSANGGKIIDDQFLYSYHDSDPYNGDQRGALNVWEAIRFHKFGHLDREDDAVGEQASGRAAKAFLAQTRPIREQMERRRLSETDIDAPDINLRRDEEDAFGGSPPPPSNDPISGPAGGTPFIDMAAQDDDGLIDFDSWGAGYVEEDEDGSGAAANAVEPHVHEDAAEDGGEPVFPEATRTTFAIGLGLNVGPSNPPLFDTNGARRACAENVELILNSTRNTQLFGKLRANELHGAAVFVEPVPGSARLDAIDVPDRLGGLAVTDRELGMLTSYFSHEIGAPVSMNVALDGVNRVAWRNPYHPVQEWLRSLVWDGVPRLDTVLETAFDTGRRGDDQLRYARQVSRMLFKACVARAMQPGVKYDYLIVLEGVENTGKSTFVESLSPVPGWYSNAMPALDAEAQKAIEAMAGKWIIEFGELTAVRKSARSKVKDFLSTTHDSARMAYAKTPREVARSCVFIATTNEDDYLSGDDGDRRFVPLRIEGRGDITWVDRHRDQLWAEALAAWEADPSLEVAGDMAQAAHEARSGAYADNAETVDAILRYLDRTPTPGDWERGVVLGVNEGFVGAEGDAGVRERVCSMELVENVLGMERADEARLRAARLQVSSAMNSIKGWKLCRGPDRRPAFGEYGQPKKWWERDRP